MVVCRALWSRKVVFDHPEDQPHSGGFAFFWWKQNAPRKALSGGKPRLLMENRARSCSTAGGRAAPTTGDVKGFYLGRAPATSARSFKKPEKSFKRRTRWGAVSDCK